MSGAQVSRYFSDTETPQMKTLKQQRRILDINGLKNGNPPKSKEQIASSPTAVLPTSREDTRTFNPFLAMFKTFGVWFFVVAGLLFFGIVCVALMGEFAMNSKAEDIWLFLAIIAVAGGSFIGLLAIAISRSLVALMGHFK
jgi:hypothetical protein